MNNNMDIQLKKPAFPYPRNTKIRPYIRPEPSIKTGTVIFILKNLSAKTPRKNDNKGMITGDMFRPLYAL
jgi:hypothetical protein